MPSRWAARVVEGVERGRLLAAPRLHLARISGPPRAAGETRVVERLFRILGRAARRGAPTTSRAATDDDTPAASVPKLSSDATSSGEVRATRSRGDRPSSSARASARAQRVASLRWTSGRCPRRRRPTGGRPPAPRLHEIEAIDRLRLLRPRAVCTSSRARSMTARPSSVANRSVRTWLTRRRCGADGRELHAAAAQDARPRTVLGMHASTGRTMGPTKRARGTPRQVATGHRWCPGGRLRGGISVAQARSCRRLPQPPAARPRRSPPKRPGCSPGRRAPRPGPRPDT